MRSPEASVALRRATDWVGYGLYLDLAQDVRTGQPEHRFPLGAEEDRVRYAIALAREGRQVALVCSGDPGIYAMAALVYELLDLEPARIAVEVLPGISAFQAAAARAGAMESPRRSISLICASDSPKTASHFSVRSSSFPAQHLRPAARNAPGAKSHRRSPARFA